MTRLTYDGGPLFPTPPGGFTCGATLRDYFAAHAPARQNWFSPDMPPAPKRDAGWEWCEGCKRDDDCLGNADCTQLKQQLADFRAWQKELEKQTEVQWPYAWADTQLAERNRTHYQSEEP